PVPLCPPLRPIVRRSIYRPSLVSLTVVAMAALGVLEPLGSSEAASSAKAVEAQHGLVVCVSRPAAEVGRAILQEGGNAVDAAVATAFALAVTYPAAGNIGGGGFMLIYPTDGHGPEVIEYRETAPSAATRTMYRKNESWYTHRAVGVPGTVR